jgi:hypothetical protein
MKIGDLVKVKGCAAPTNPIDFPCECFFCNGHSNRIGLIMSPAPMNSWVVMFDCGEWRLDKFDFARGDAEVVSESR